MTGTWSSWAAAFWRAISCSAAACSGRVSWNVGGGRGMSCGEGARGAGAGKEGFGDALRPVGGGFSFS